MRNKKGFLPWKDDGLPLEDDELIVVLSLKLVDELGEVTVTVVAKGLGTQVRHLILGFGVVDSDLAFLHQVLSENIPKHQVQLECGE